MVSVVVIVRFCVRILSLGNLILNLSDSALRWGRGARQLELGMHLWDELHWNHEYCTIIADDEDDQERAGESLPSDHAIWHCLHMCQIQLS